MASSPKKQVRSVAFGYAVFSLMYVVTAGGFLYIMGWHGFNQAIQDLKLFSSTLIQISILAVVNIMMTMATWKVLSLSRNKQRLILGFSTGLAVFAAIKLAGSLWAWAFVAMPDWYSPIYYAFPPALLTFGYGYLAWALYKPIRISNNKIQRTGYKGHP